MSKTTFSDKADILGELWLNYRQDIKGNDAWEEFFEWADVALPLSFMLSKGYADMPTDDGVEMIEQAWDVFCEMIEIDAQAEYANLGECFEKSPNKEI
jgi:hypothetical protein